MIGQPMTIALVSLLAMAQPGLAMNNYDNPRVILSYMDKSLDGPRDILRVTTAISAEGQLTFQIKTREGKYSPQDEDYMILEVQQQNSHHFLVPLNPALGEAVLAYTAEHPGEPEPHPAARALESGSALSLASIPAFSAKRIAKGFEFSVPLTWLDYGKGIVFDAYTARGQLLADTFVIEEVYDRAAKGDRERRLVSPIMLLNNLCATRPSRDPLGIP
ncbi:MAG: hypothetical protein P8Q97_13305 [Myxococcota bacterium]|nr:hypothetical protein [Myxococcota bacterium]